MFNNRLSLSSQLVARQHRFAEVAQRSCFSPGLPAGHTPPHPLPPLYLGTKPHLRKRSSSAFPSLPKDILSPLLIALITLCRASERQLSCCLSLFFMGIRTQGLPTAFICFPSGQRGILSCSPKRHRGHRNVFCEPSEPLAAGDSVASLRGSAFSEGEHRKTLGSHPQVTVSRRQLSFLYDPGRGVGI